MQNCTIPQPETEKAILIYILVSSESHLIDHLPSFSVARGGGEKPDEEASAYKPCSFTRAMSSIADGRSWNRDFHGLYLALTKGGAEPGH